MNPLTLAIVVILVLALLETPLFTIIAALSIACLYLVEHDWLALQTILIEMNRLGAMPVLVALPLFTLVGCLLTETRSPQRIMNFLDALMGWLPGGLAMAALCACAFFTALTGASGVTIVALGSVLYPVMRDKGYGEEFTLGLLTTSGSLGLLFPPSLPIILYGVVAQVDIGNIFKAALVPGLLLIGALCVYAFFKQLAAGRRRSVHSGISVKRVKAAFLDGIWDWPVIGIILVGVYGGFVTIAEVSAVVLIYVVVVECFVLKEISFFNTLPSVIVESAVLSGAIIVILGVALGFTGFLVDQQIPNQILEWLTALSDSKLLFLAGLNLFLLAVGCIMDIFSAIVIVVPIIVPIALSYGVDPIHLCVIFLVNLEIGYSTPPVGINLFISSLKFEKPVTLLYRSSLPYLLILLGVLIVITYFPWLSLFFI
ncbi:TRAP transporter large permease subunit [Desulfosarcina sp.]|uniref:TRAP transporter large permease n=1 Tax=Desulfosarcina sp. TaxID=2027861 RepID=UPI0029A8CACD|nr:TRAP transporter large permease subunit [Desulfosarcina sp.]MDX2452872.1 TRAP transporter large permease subunit [Desulfosarcina sp.]MDX2490616.1 TRAP transporter large permease subunit [Desulfosarcina sp.]